MTRFVVVPFGQEQAATEHFKAYGVEVLEMRELPTLPVTVTFCCKAAECGRTGSFVAFKVSGGTRKQLASTPTGRRRKAKVVTSETTLMSKKPFWFQLC